jgi:large subunit ribosomal protein L19
MVTFRPRTLNNYSKDLGMAKAAKKTASKSAGKSAKAAAPKATAPKKAKAAKASSGPKGETDLVRRVALKKVANNTKIQEFGAGDTVGVYVKVREGDKERVQLYKGVCIKVQGEGVTRTFTVRKISAGVGVERTFPFRSPSVDRVEVIAKGKVRRSKLYFLRELKGKAARLTSEMVGLVDTSIPEETAETASSEG